MEFVIEGSLKLTGEDKYVEFQQGCMNLIKNFQLVDDACIFHTITLRCKSRYLHLLAVVPQDIPLQLDYFEVGGGPNAFENKNNYGKGKGRGNKGNNAKKNGLDPIVYLTFKVSCDFDQVTIVNRAVYSWKQIEGIFIRKKDIQCLSTETAWIAFHVYNYTYPKILKAEFVEILKTSK